MDIIYKLPFPQEVCSKIFIFACKSRHCDLSVAILKKIIGNWDVSSLPSNTEIKSRGSHLSERQLRRRAILIASARRRAITIYNKLSENDEITLNHNGYVIKLSVEFLSFAEKDKISFDIAHLKTLPKLTAIDVHRTGVTGNIDDLKSLQNLTRINLGYTFVTGNIEHLKSLPKLTEINLFKTGVSGDIVHLKSLQNLTMIDLSYSDVTGNIEYMKSLQNLTRNDLSNTRVFGDIVHLKSLPKLRSLCLDDTDVYGDEDEFNEYRLIERLSLCELHM